MQTSLIYFDKQRDIIPKKVMNYTYYLIKGRGGDADLYNLRCRSFRNMSQRQQDQHEKNWTLKTASTVALSAEAAGATAEAAGTTAEAAGATGEAAGATAGAKA